MRKARGGIRAKYYCGIVYERSGKSALERQTPRACYIAFEFYQQAMILFEEAENLQPSQNEDAILRWNACARKIQENNLKAAPSDEQILY